MEIASLATKMSYINTMEQVNISMMDRAIDQMELAGEQLAMMIAATQVLLTGEGSSVDISI